MTPTAWGLAGVTTAALLVSAALLWAALPALRRYGVMDVPAHRSLHDVATPRGGGVAVLLAVLLCSVAAAGLGVAGASSRWWVAVLLPVLVLGLVGLRDDVRSAPVPVRLLAQVGAGAALGLVLCALTGRPPIWVLPVVLVTVALVNATNFMDGANGLVGAHAAVSGAWYLVVALVVSQPPVAVLGAAVCGASLGFLPWNAPRARVFLGDVGSYALGGLWAVVVAWLVMSGAPPEPVLAPMLVLVADTGVTIVRRVLDGDAVTTPHRLHVYQRLVRAGWSHTRVAAVVASGTVVLCGLSVPALLGAPALVRSVALLLSFAVCVGYLSLTVRAGARARWAAARERVPS